MKITINNMQSTPKDLRAMLAKSEKAVARMATVERLKKETKEWASVERDLNETRATMKRNEARLAAHVEAALVDSAIAASIGATITEDEEAE